MTQWREIYTRVFSLTSLGYGNAAAGDRAGRLELAGKNPQSINQKVTKFRRNWAGNRAGRLERTGAADFYRNPSINQKVTASEISAEPGWRSGWAAEGWLGLAGTGSPRLVYWWFCWIFANFEVVNMVVVEHSNEARFATGSCLVDCRQSTFAWLTAGSYPDFAYVTVLVS